MVLTMGLTALADPDVSSYAPSTNNKNTITIKKADGSESSAQGTVYTMYKVAEKEYDEAGNSYWKLRDEFKELINDETWGKLTDGSMNSSTGRNMDADIQKLALKLEKSMRQTDGSIKDGFATVAWPNTAIVDDSEYATFSNVTEGYYLILETETPASVKIISSLPMLAFVNDESKEERETGKVIV